MENFLSPKDPDIETIDAMLSDFGFYHSLSDTLHMFAEYENHGHLGYDGGVMDQPEAYWRDMATMRWLKLWVEHVKPMPRLKHESVFDRLKEGKGLTGKLQ